MAGQKENTRKSDDCEESGFPKRARAEKGDGTELNVENLKVEFSGRTTAEIGIQYTAGQKRSGTRVGKPKSKAAGKKAAGPKPKPTGESTVHETPECQPNPDRANEDDPNMGTSIEVELTDPAAFCPVRVTTAKGVSVEIQKNNN